NEVLVSAGQEVAQDQALLVVNADKSTMEVRAPMAGKVVKMTVKQGDELKTGAVYCVLEASNGAAAPARSETKPAPAKAAPAKTKPSPPEDNDKPAEQPAPKQAVPNRPHSRLPVPEPGVVPASPATRWLARKLGVDLGQVRGSGPRGRVTEDDVR